MSSPTGKKRKTEDETGEGVDENAKKPKQDNDDPANATESSSIDTSFYDSICADRTSFASSVAESPVNKHRVRLMTKSAKKIDPEATGGIAYWMLRDQRVQDNWALLYAQQLALQRGVPLHVVVGFIPNKFHLINLRTAAFQIKGLQEVEEECHRLGIGFHLLQGTSNEMPNIVKFVKDHSIAALIADFSPLRHPLKWLKSVSDKCDEKDIPVWQVDAHNIVPCWRASDHLEVGARTLRGKITRALPEYLTPFPAVAEMTGDSSAAASSAKVEWEKVVKNLVANGLDDSVKPVKWAVGGSKPAFVKLDEFIKGRLKHFATDRNNPNRHVASDLSPWITYGQISMQRCVLQVKALKSKHSEGVDSYVEEAFVRKELSDNFCFYQPKYDSLDGAAGWARETLDTHAKDERSHVYTLKQFKDSETHDALWNGAQRQLVKEGKMHGFLRMYWAKKILEWASSPADALKIAIYLNDHFSVDGRCPNGFVGCMWSVCGTHDQGWKERPIFGKIRYMNYEGCKRKFDVTAFEMKYRRKADGSKK